MLKKVDSDWQVHLDRVVQDQSTRYQAQLQEKDRMNAQVVSQLEQTQTAYNTALSQLEKYRSLLPFRLYRAIKRLSGRQ